MDNYNEVVKISKTLLRDFKEKITVAEALQIAAQIQVSEVLSQSLIAGYAEEINPLEAISVVLGFSKRPGSASILSALQEIADKGIE